MRSVAALLPLDRTRPPPPLDALPMGRAARRLLNEGVVVVLADTVHDGRVSGYRATTDGWVEAEGIAVCGVYDRFPMPKYPERHAALVRELGSVPFGNPPSLRELSRDKLVSQHLLEEHGVRMPPVSGVWEDFPVLLAQWGVAFAKPRFGAVGAGVQRVVTDDAVPPTSPGPLGEPEPTLLQRAVPPPPGWAGIATRTLVQRDATGRWVTSPPIARRSRADAVVNVARGAEAAAAEDVLPAESVAELRRLAILSAEALASGPGGEMLLEVGVDAMIDDALLPWVIEINTRPWGRLHALYKADPSRWSEAHIEACARPFRWLAGRAPR